MYADQEQIITLWVFAPRNGGDPRVHSEVSFRNSFDNTDDAYISGFELCQIRQNWPAYLKNFKRLQVRVFFLGPLGGPPSSSTLQAGTSQLLTSLTACLASDDSLKLETLRVTIHAPTRLPNQHQLERTNERGTTTSSTRHGQHIELSQHLPLPSNTAVSPHFVTRYPSSCVWSGTIPTSATHPKEAVLKPTSGIIREETLPSL